MTSFFPFADRWLRLHAFSPCTHTIFIGLQLISCLNPCYVICPLTSCVDASSIVYATFPKRELISLVILLCCLKLGWIAYQVVIGMHPTNLTAAKSNSARAAKQATSNSLEMDIGWDLLYMKMNLSDVYSLMHKVFKQVGVRCAHELIRWYVHPSVWDSNPLADRIHQYCPCRRAMIACMHVPFTCVLVPFFLVVLKFQLLRRDM